jgi:hypothetical protein
LREDAHDGVNQNLASQRIRQLRRRQFEKLHGVLGQKTAVEDRLSANIEAIYKNLDRA